MVLNKIKSVLLLAALSGILLFLGNAIGGIYGLQGALIIALAMNGIIYFFSEQIVLRMYRAQPLDRYEYSWIYEDVQALANRMLIPSPKLWLVHTPIANAFATGRSPAHSSIALTTGIVSLLNENELRGVLAHELSHIKNRDTLITTIAATIATAIGYLAHMLQYAAMWGAYDRDNRQRTNVVTIFLLALLMPIAASLLQLALSRSREYLADETGAHESEDPLALASALEKIHQSVKYSHFDANDAKHASTASLFIVHPYISGKFMELFSTHPPLHKRIELLQQIAEKMYGRRY